VKPAGTPLAWDVRRAKDDPRFLGTGLPTLVPDPADSAKAALKTNETGSFFVRVFGDCGNGKFDADVPFKLVPTVLVQAILETDSTTKHPANISADTRPSDSDPESRVFFVETGIFNLEGPGTAAIHMEATVALVSGGPFGRLLLDQVFAGWVNTLYADNRVCDYLFGHRISFLSATNDGSGPQHIFQRNDKPKTVAKPLLDTFRPNPGTGGDTAILRHARIRSRGPREPVGQRLVVEAVDSPYLRNLPTLHPIFSTAAAPSRLFHARFELHFSAHLCLWTDRSGASGGVAERSYGVLRSFDWHVMGEWNIDIANHARPTTQASIEIDGRVTRDPLARPENSHCEVCPPTVTALDRLDGRI
jgi:hypothetical protein